jgi:hypothetical protein
MSHANGQAVFKTGVKCYCSSPFSIRIASDSISDKISPSGEIMKRVYTKDLTDPKFQDEYRLLRMNNCFRNVAHAFDHIGDHEHSE